MNEYRILNCESIKEYVGSVGELKEFFGGDEIVAKEVGDGNLNQVFIVQSLKQPAKSIAIKQALPYLRCAGEGYPLDRDRMKYEIRSLLKYSKLCGKHTPRIYHADEAMSLVAMQDLSHCIIMRKGIVEGIRYPHFAQHISSFLAETLFKTSSLYLGSKQKRELSAKFIGNSELCKLTEDFVFSAPYMTHDTNRHNPHIDEDVARVRSDGVFKSKVMQLKYLFMNSSESLIHGDLHTGSVMLTESDTYVIDSEFAFMGPMGFDVGAVFANLLMAYCSYFVREDKAYQEWLLETAFEVMQLFFAKFRVLWDENAGESAMLLPNYWDGCKKSDYDDFKNNFMMRLLQESIGFAGLKMMRRQMGIAHVLDIESIEDEKLRAVAERKVIKIARELVVSFAEFQNLQQLKDDVSELAK